MADIVRTVAIGQRATREDLQDLVGEARLTNVDWSDLSSAARAAVVQASSEPPAAPADGQLWWDMTWRLLRAYDGVSGLFCAIGPDSFEFPAVASQPMIRGQPVRLDGGLTVQFGVPVVSPLRAPFDSRQCVGTLSDTAASGGYVRVGWWGLVHAFLSATCVTYSYNVPYQVDELNLAHLRNYSVYTGAPYGRLPIAQQIEFSDSIVPFASQTSCPRLVLFTGPFSYTG